METFVNKISLSARNMSRSRQSSGSSTGSAYHRQTHFEVTPLLAGLLRGCRVGKKGDAKGISRHPRSVTVTESKTQVIYTV